MNDNISQDVVIRGEGNIVVGKGDVIINPLPPAEARLRHDLGILLKNVENTWIKGVLEKSVYEVALVDLGIELRDDAVDNPWRIVMEGPGKTRETLARGRKIKDIFDEANHLLLILGDPGSGKTTTLLQLTRDLIADVDSSFTQAVPVILNLSTWTNKHQPLDEWLVAELNSKYRVPKNDGKRWLQDRRILPLLDGLDEVKAENRTACVERINDLVGKYGLQGMAVCSRIQEYTNLNIRLAFYRAIYIQPLSPEQVDEYLHQAGEKLVSLRATLQDDQALRDMAQSPLILNIMSLAYQNSSAESLSNAALTTNKARRQHLFDTYITRMLNRKASERTYTDELIRFYLSWLASNMQQHNQEVFLIEALQPSWLSTRSWRIFYFLISRLLGGVLLSFGLHIFRVASDRPGSDEPFSMYWLILPLCLALIDIIRIEWLNKQMKSSSSQIWWSVINAVIIGAISGSTYTLLNDFNIGYIQASGLAELNRKLTNILSFDLFLVMIAGLIFGLSFGLRGAKQSSEMDIETVDALRWSWRKAAKGGLLAGVIGLIFGSFLAVRVSTGSDNFVQYVLVNFLYWGRGFLVIFAIGGFIFNGLRREITETKSLPNEGIRLSMRNAILGGLIFGVGSGVPVVLSDMAQFDVITALGLAVSFGVMGTLWYGGFDVIQHYTLRLMLIIQGYTPRDYAAFLDFAVDRIFLQKVGGGYRFIHRLLLEHFADMNENRKI